MHFVSPETKGSSVTILEPLGFALHKYTASKQGSVLQYVKQKTWLPAKRSCSQNLYLENILYKLPLVSKTYTQYTFIHLHVLTYICTSIDIYLYTYTHSAHAHTYIICTHMHTFVCVHIYMQSLVKKITLQQALDI